MRHALTVLAVAGLFAWARAARAEPTEEGAGEAGTIPILIEAGSGPLQVGEALCLRGSCTARVRPGIVTVSRLVSKEGGFSPDFTTEVTLDQPSIIRVPGPGALRTVSFVVLVAGATIAIAGFLVPLLVCRSSTRVDATTGAVTSTKPCDGVSDAAKVAWIGGTGAGITLATIGAVLVAVTGWDPHASVEPWPRASAKGIPSRIQLTPLAGTRPLGDRGAPWGLGLEMAF